MIQENLKEEIKNRLKLSDVISKKISLKRKGENRFVALCPFHNEKTPSFNVQDDKGFYHCFGCGKHGDIFNFVMEIDNLDFKEAIKYLSEQAGISINNVTIRRNVKLLKILQEAKLFFINTLSTDEGILARKYLIKRKINNALCKDFDIGYAPPRHSKMGLINHLVKKGFSFDEIVKSGLGKKKNDAVHGYFYERLIIPIHSKEGNVVAFGGRVISEGNPKYLNSPENEVFSKRNIVFGINNVNKNNRLKDSVILCEGYMDVISLKRNGFSALACLGTSATDYQLEQIINLYDKIFVVFDGDEAGKNATLRVFDKILALLKLGKIFKFVFLPNNLDPEEFIDQEGLLAFEKKLEQAYSVTDIIWLMGMKIKKDEQPETIAKVWDFLRKKVNLINNNNLKLAVKDELEKRIRKFRLEHKEIQYNSNNYRKLNLKLPFFGLDIRFKAILLLIVYYPSMFFEMQKKIEETNFVNLKFNKIKEEILKIFLLTPNITSKELIKELQNKGFSDQLDNFDFEIIFSRFLINKDELNKEKCKNLLNELLDMIKKTQTSNVKV